MPIVLTIYVDTPEDTSYDTINVYRSSFEDGYFSYIGNISISAPTKYYNFEDSSGSPGSWYKTQYYLGFTPVGSLSSAQHGIEVELEHVLTTYPAEISMTSSDHYNVDKIRHYIGDNKKVQRNYVSPLCSIGYENVSDDGGTYELTERGWPLRVVKDYVEYTTLLEPYVTDYRFITFSGSQISTSSGILDVFFESFRHSDREVMKVFTTVSLSPKEASSTASLTESQTTEVYRIKSAMSIIKSEIASLMGESKGKFNLQGELSYDPEGLLKQKRAFLEELKEMLDDIIPSGPPINITGVRID